MLVFFDTEFTKFHNPMLLSVGLVADTGEEFYAELPYKAWECGEFTRDVVLPLFGREPDAACEDVYALQTRLLTWLTLVKRRDTLFLCYGADVDWELLEPVLGRVPAFCQPRQLYSNETNELMRWDFFQRSGLPEHHALYDARALKHAYRPGWR